MQIETFRYLMSALAQVYGALIFGVAVFLVLRFREIKDAVERRKRRLAPAVVVAQIHRLWKSSPAGSKPPSVEFRTLRQSEFTAFTRAEIREAVEGAIAVIETEKARARDPETKAGISQEIASVQRLHGQYESSEDRMVSFPKRAVRVLGVRAFLCWLFSFTLIFADRLGGYLQTENLAGWAIVLAGAGLGYLVLAASDMLKESSAGEPSETEASPDE